MKLQLSLHVLVTLMINCAVCTSLVLDNNQFLIYNKVYHKARLTQWSAGFTNVGTFEHALYEDQLWTLEPHPYQKGCYYIVNEIHSQYRIADASHTFIVYNGAYYDDQLFRFVPSGYNDGFFYIYSCFHTNDRITKYGAGNHQVTMYSGPRYNDQLWKLVPRFEVNFYTDEVFHYDNRQSSNPITLEITVTTGIKRSSSRTITNKSTYKMSVEASMEAAYKMFSMSATTTAEYSSELETTFSESNELSWSKTKKITFTISPKKNFKVMQHKVNFDGQFSHDSCSLLTSIKIFESDTAHFEDRDNFLISYGQ